MIEWTDALSIDVARIDDQHRTFIGLVNRLNAFSNSNASHAELRTILAELVCYAEVHFSDEEDWMRQSGYPQIQEHAAAHSAAAATIHDMMFRDVEGQDLYSALGAFLMPWLVTHIMKHDKAFGDWLKLQHPAEQGA
ncbi:bacteriohemerythrin [Azospirillum sp. sgz301742]